MHINQNNYNVSTTVNRTTTLENKSKNVNEEIQKIKLKVETVDQKGKVLQTETIQGNSGSAIQGLKIPSVSGYTLSGIKVNGKSVDINTFKFPTTMPNANETIQYVYKANEHIATVSEDNITKPSNLNVKDGQTTVNVMNQMGIAIASKVINGPVGNKIGNILPTLSIPTNDQITSIAYDGTPISQSDLSNAEYKPGKNILVITVYQPHTILGNLVLPGNRSIPLAIDNSETKITANNMTVDCSKQSGIIRNFSIKSVEIDGETFTTGITYNNGIVTVNGVMPTNPTTTDHVTINLEAKSANPNTNPNKKPSTPVQKVALKVEAVDQSGKVLQTQTTTGNPGSTIQGLKVPSVSGYTLTGIEVNGKNVDMNTFKLPTTIPNANETIKYIYKANEYTTTVEVKDSTGKIVAQKVTKGIEGTTVEAPKIPSGAKIVNVEVNGVVSKSNSYPTQITDKNNTVIINVQMPHTATVKYVDENGKELAESTTIGIDGANINYPSTSTAYKIKSITVNGKIVNEKPTKLGNTDETIVITYENPTVQKLTIEAVDQNGKVLGSQTTQGESGTLINGLKAPSVSGYTLTDIKVNGKSVDMNTFKLPTTMPNTNETIQYIYKANEYTTTVSVVENGKVLDKKVTKGIEGTKVQIPAIPTGTHIASVNVNGVVSKGDSYPSEITNKNTNIIINVEQNKVPHKINITFDYSDGTKQTGTATEVEGTSIQYPTIQAGYKISEIMVNGQKVTSLPKIMGNMDINIVVTLVKDSTTNPDTKPSNPNTKPSNSGTDTNTPNTKPSNSGTDTNTPNTKPSNSGTDINTPNTKPSNSGTDTNTPNTKPSNSGTDINTPNTKPNNSGTDINTPNTKPNNSGANTNTPNIKPSNSGVDTNNSNIQSGENGNTESSNSTAKSSVVKGESVTPNVNNNANNNELHSSNENSNNNSSNSNKIEELPETGLSQVVNNKTTSMGVVALLGSLLGLTLLFKRKK